MATLPSFDVNQLLPDVRKSGVAMLRTLSEDEWLRPTACSGWNVHDVALHITGGLLANVSRRRDGHPGNFTAFAPVVSGGTSDAFDATLNAWNEAWVVAARRIGPRLLIEVLDLAGRDLEEYFRTLDLTAMGGPVGWAGPDPAPVGLDVAREYTEIWTHLAQIREATGRALVDDARLFAPVLETFLFALPYTLRGIDRPQGTRLAVRLTGPSGGIWTVQRGADRWHLHAGESSVPEAEVEIEDVIAWRLATKGMSSSDASPLANMRGDLELCAGFFKMIAILG